MTAAPGARRLRERFRLPELLREREFRHSWTGQSVSFFGDEVSRIAMPLAAVTLLGARPGDMGLLTAASLFPSLFFSMAAGAWADRRRSRRRVMICADVGRFLVLLTIPVSYALGGLTLTQLYAAAFAVGTFGVFFDVCSNTLYAALVAPEQYVRASSLLYGSRAMAFVAGPGVGGVLVGLVRAPFALLADAFSYLVSAFCLARIAPPEPPPGERERGHFTAGLRWVVGTPAMRSFQLAAVTLNFFNFIYHALVVLYATRSLGLSAATLGAAMGIGAVGGLAGAACAGRLVGWLGIGPVITGAFVVFSAPLVLIPMAGGTRPVVVALVGAATFGSSFGVVVLDIAAEAFQTALIPDALRARVRGVTRTVNYGIRPLGALAGGALGTATGPRPALWVATVGAVFAVGWVLASPIPRMRALPEPVAAGTEEKAVAGRER